MGDWCSAQSITLGQNTISTIANSDPLIISGAIGTQNTYYHSSIGDGYRSPWANSLYANLNISVYGIAMPFSFYYSNDNSSFNFPHISFHIDPTYKNWKAHFGRSTMSMSSYIMNMSFNGVGLEYTGSKLRVGAFYGELRKAVNDDPSDPSARAPQYHRMGWGLKLGYGRQRNFIDLYLLRAKDKVGSINEAWQQRIRPQENLAVGLRGGLGITRWLTLRGNLAFSAISSDSRAEKVESEQLDRWGDVFSAKYSSLMRIAADASANVTLKGISGSVYYRMVQPDYTTLGLYYNSNNYQALGISLSTVLFGKVSLSGNFSGQQDNITGNQLYTTSGYVYSATASTRIGSNLSLAAGYNGYRQLQTDGKAHVNDTTRVNRMMHAVYVTPSYTLEGEHLNHIISLSANYSENADLNRFSTGTSDVRTIAAGLSYNVEVKPWEMSFSSSLSHQQSNGYNTRYSSDVLSVSTGRSFFEEKNLSTSATFSLCLNHIKDQQNMMSMGVDLSAGYTYKKVHVFSFSAGLNKYADTNISDDNSSINTSEFSMSLGYTYTFSLLEIKRKAHTQKEPKKR